MSIVKKVSLAELALPVMLIVSLLAAISTQVNAACCYFSAKDKDVNQPGQKAFITWRPATKEESFTVQPKFEGNATDFGMVIPTPSRPKLDEMPRDFFKNLALYTILMPLPEPIYSPLDPEPEYKCYKEGAAPSRAAREKVKVLESGVVGSLDYKILQAEDASALFEWLKHNHYVYSGDEKTLQFYIQKKWIFTVMKIDPKQMKRSKDGSYLGEVTPTSFKFSSEQCVYPLKITQISVKDRTDALFYVQAPQQMDLQDDWSWMHSYRSMYLTYMLGCGADQKQQQELQECNTWVNLKRQKDPQFETTKLEWAKLLGNGEMSVLEDPVKNYGQFGAASGGGDLPPGAKVVPLDAFLIEMKSQYQKRYTGPSDYAKEQLARMGDIYQPAKGVIVKYDDNTVGKSYRQTHYAWYPARQVPLEEIKGLSLLKGHLQKGQWLTKFRKVLRKDEMTQDMILADVPKEKQQTYIRIMPTSPP